MHCIPIWTQITVSKCPASPRMYFVSISDFKHLTDSSSKVEQITRQVLELMKDDPAVKIVIFSQWAVILTNLEKAFAMNNISFRNNLHRFYESVREFKVTQSSVYLDITSLWAFS